MEKSWYNEEISAYKIDIMIKTSWLKKKISPSLKLDFAVRKCIYFFAWLEPLESCEWCIYRMKEPEVKNSIWIIYKSSF